jgi:hypothetical protein
MALISHYIALACGKTDKQLTENDMAGTVLAYFMYCPDICFWKLKKKKP